MTDDSSKSVVKHVAAVWTLSVCMQMELTQLSQ